jgi:hypothetical protein
MSDLSNKILQTIENQKIEPRPKWQFIAKSYTLWILAGLSLIFGSIASSMVFLNITDTAHMPTPPCLLNPNFPPCHESSIHWFFLAIPYAWLITLGLFIWVLYYNIRHFKKAYHYPAWLLISSAFLGSILLGSLLSLAGLHRSLDDAFSRRIPIYTPMFDARVHVWQRPDEGFMAGRVKQMVTGGFDLEDFQKNIWQINLDSETIVDQEAINLNVGDMVRVIGEKTADNQFRAEEIKSWNPSHYRNNPAGPLGKSSNTDSVIIINN